MYNVPIFAAYWSTFSSSFADLDSTWDFLYLDCNIAYIWHREYIITYVGVRDHYWTTQAPSKTEYFFKAPRWLNKVGNVCSSQKNKGSCPLRMLTTHKVSESQFNF